MERKRISGEAGEFIMERVFLSMKNKTLSECALFEKLRKYPEYGDAVVQISKVDRKECGYQKVLSEMDFDTLCVACDIMARFDFVCLLNNPRHNRIIAVFGGVKLYGSNLSLDTFWDNVQSCDPEKAYLKINGEPTSQAKREEFVLLWKSLVEKVKNAGMELGVLMIAFGYPHPVGTMEYKDFMEKDLNKLVYFIGHEKLNELQQVISDASGLIAACTGTENPTKRRKLQEQLSLKDAEDKVLQRFDSAEKSKS